MNPFSTNMNEIRERARKSMSDGAVTDGYKADRKEVVTVLNQALATEIVCVLRYRYHYFMAEGLASEAVKAEFLEHSIEEQAHADKLATRICQLNGKPELNPAGLLSLSHAEYTEGDGLIAMIEEDLVAERVVVQIYAEIIRWLGDTDPTTSQMLKGILQKEEEHAEDLASLLKKIPAAQSASIAA